MLPGRLAPDTSELARITPARQAGSTRLTYLGGMEGRVNLDGWLHTEMVYLSSDSHPSK